MLKKLLLITLAILLIFGACACSNESQEPTDAPDADETEQKETDSETNGNASSDSVLLSGDTRYRIIYPKDANPANARRIYNKLKALDKNAVKDDYYVLATDETPDDGTPEILVGLTNRAASAEAQSALPTYLDYSITVSEKKIIVSANTEDRLSEAVKYFVGKLEKKEDGSIYYPTVTAYVNSYDKYAFPSLKIGGAEINGFSIVIPTAATELEKSAANDVRLWIAEQTGRLLPIKPDAEAASANEIIIGKANREECSIYTDDYQTNTFYSVTLNASKLLLFAKHGVPHSSAISAFKSKVTELNGDLSAIDVKSSAEPINNKKAIFIGNSFIYWGNCVTFITNDEANDAIRIQGGDKGYFNEICKANGINMDVYNYTYGGQSLNWIYTNKLKNLEKSFLDSIDYVFISEAGGADSNFLTTIEAIMALFPNAKETAYLGHEFSYRTNDTNSISNMPALKQKGVKIVAWGELVCDVYNGKVDVPGATLEYNRNSFVKHSTGKMPENAAVTSLSGNGDSHHQNPLAGYITAQMCFSAISGLSCEGQRYDFCSDKTIAPQYDLQNFLECQYNNGQTSNFIEIFNSPADMLGLQTLMDQYLAKHN
ncbi:MAG: hypothetical protein IIX30_04165 [Clostridia bacterium]|nr:hypothetical protein [Clostridia bacterium]